MYTVCVYIYIIYHLIVIIYKSNDTCGYLQQVVPEMITLPYEIYRQVFGDRSQMTHSMI